MIRWCAFCLLCTFYGAYLWKLFAQRRQGITTNVMIRGQKSRRAYRIGIMLVLTTDLTCAAQFLSCFWSGRMGPVPVPEVLRVCGLVLMAVGTAVFIAAFQTLKDSWRAGIDESQKTELVTGGVYRISRNPAFLGFDLLYLGSALALGNALLFAAVGAVVIMIHLQILEEEKHLVKMFGAPYLDYQKNVRRYL